MTLLGTREGLRYTVELEAQSTDLSVIIVNWNTANELRSCLYSVRDSNRGNTQVIVVDNASADGSSEMIREEFPWVDLVANDRNLGFGKGCNTGLKVARGRYIFMLNPDSGVVPGAFESIVEFGDEHPDVGIFGVKVLNPNLTVQYSCRRFPTLAAGIFRNSILGHFFPNNPYTREYLMAEWDHSLPREVDWVSGCALVVRRETVEQLNGFDEDYYMYCEDVDLAFRARQKGWKVMYCPSAVTVHARSKASDKSPNHMIFEFHKSMYRFFKKHYAGKSSLPVRMLVPMGLVARAGAFIVRNRWHRFMAKLRRHHEPDLYEVVQNHVEASREVGKEDVTKEG